MNKKGQIAQLQGLYLVVITIVIIGIGLGIGIYILDQTALATSSTAYTVTTENVTATSNLATVATASNCGFQTFVLTSVANGSGTFIDNANFTTSAAAGTLNNASGVGLAFGSQAWRLNYTYTGAVDTSATSSCGALSTSSTGIGGLASWMVVIVVVLAAAIVLGLVTSAFGKGSAV